jgi:hypothetical protein
MELYSDLNMESKTLGAGEYSFGALRLAKQGFWVREKAAEKFRPEHLLEGQKEDTQVPSDA